MLSFCWYQNVLSPFLAHPPRVRSCRRDLKLVEIEPVNEKVLRIKDYLVGSGRDGGSLCVLSAEDEIFFFRVPSDFANGASEPRQLICIVNLFFPSVVHGESQISYAWFLFHMCRIFFWINHFLRWGEADREKDVWVINWISLVVDIDTPVMLGISNVMFNICSRIMHALLHVDYIYPTLIGLCFKMTASGALCCIKCIHKSLPLMIFLYGYFRLLSLQTFFSSLCNPSSPLAA